MGSERTRKIDRVIALCELERLLHRLCKIVFDDLARQLASQKICPQEFAERRRVLGKAAGAAQFAGKAAERIVLEVLDRFRKIIEMPPLALGIVGIDPALVVHHAPKGVLLDHSEVADHGHQNVLDAFVMQCAGEMMMVDYVMALVRTDDDRDHVLADHLALLLCLLLPQALALLPALPHPYGDTR